MHALRCLKSHPQDHSRSLPLIARDAADNRVTLERNQQGLPSSSGFARCGQAALYTPHGGCKPLPSTNKENVMCIHCIFGLQPVRLRRRWVHHFADTGQIVVCEEKNVKPAQ